MFKFNNNHIFTGYLKQLLNSVNLPNYKVYTQEQARIKESTGKEANTIISSVDKATWDILTTEDIDKKEKAIYSRAKQRHIRYIKGNQICEYIDAVYKDNIQIAPAHWNVIDYYYENRKTLNGIDNLIIKNTLYDNDTHEYLGRYLRFLRDYYNVNLMPLYNCFGNHYCNNLKLSNLPQFNSYDAAYKIYMLPVKFCQQYTIAIDCLEPVEVFCGLYATNIIENTAAAQNLQLATYQKFVDMHFNQPVLYDKLKSDDFINKFLKINNTREGEIADKESQLKLFIKLPTKNASSITILEGDYRNCQFGWVGKIKKTNNTTVANAEEGTEGNDITTEEDTTPKKLTWYQNYIVTNFEDKQLSETGIPQIISAEKFSATRTFNPITPLQLLKYNTGISYPFSDNLIAYLLNSNITPLDPCGDNIERAQKIVNGAPSASLTVTTKILKLGEPYWDPEGEPQDPSEWPKKYYLKPSSIDPYEYETKTVTAAGIVTKQDGIWDSRMSPLFYNFYQNNRDYSEINYDNLGYIDKELEIRYIGTVWNDAHKKLEVCSIAKSDIYPEMYKASKQ